jgi:hypothetical protein
MDSDENSEYGNSEYWAIIGRYDNADNVEYLHQLYCKIDMVLYKYNNYIK